MSIERLQRKCDEIIRVANEVFVSSDEEILKKVLCGFIAGGHILFEDNPGLGKTLLVKVFSRIMGCSWKRIQFTPDLLPADIVGTKVWRGANSEFQLEKGPVFTNILLADEINRAMPKTQSALLEAMEEKQVTIEGVTYPLEPPFTVMATQNPIEMEGTYSLPEAQLDRFIMKLSMGYLESLEEECEILKRRISWGKDDPTENVPTVLTQAELLEMQQEVEKIYVDDNILRYIGEIVRKTRNDSRIMLGASPRGGIALLKLSRAYALVCGRDYVIPDDVKMLSPDVLAHRILLNIEHAVEGLKPASVIRSIVSNTEVPKSYTRGT
jgi:MoxR-like ATPase